MRHRCCRSSWSVRRGRVRRRGSDDRGGVTRAGVNDDYNLRTVWFVTLSTSDGSDAVRAGISGE